LIDWKNASWQNRAHFFGISAQLMRHILVDYARRRPQLRRTADSNAISLDGAFQLSRERSEDLVALDDALQALNAIDSRKARIVELRFFGGLEEREIAEVLEVSTRTVEREWKVAKAWLYNELSSTGSPNV
jgi:RNA polymerase sigma factor (TIGR02999 family)